MLGFAILITESEDGCYEPVAIISSLEDALAVTRSEFHQRVRCQQDGASLLCPYSYKLWARGNNGYYQVAREFTEIDFA